MEKILKYIGMYSIPIFFVITGLSILKNDPYTRVSVYIPLVVREDQYLIAAVCFVVAGILGLIRYRYERKKAEESEKQS